LDPNYENIDPCTNFDQYVCGGWRENHDMRPDQGSIFAGTIMEENAQTRLRHILDRPEAPQLADADNFKKLKAAYDACLDEPAISKRGTKPLTDILDELEKIYPAKTGLVKGSQEHLTSAILYLLNAGVEALASPGVTVSLFDIPIQRSSIMTGYSPMTKTRTMSLSLSLLPGKLDFLQENTTITRRQSLAIPLLSSKSSKGFPEMDMIRSLKTLLLLRASSPM
jgi:hypothetical protein